MAATKIGFFNPLDVLGQSAGGFIQQSDGFTNSQNAEEAKGLKADGNFNAKDIFNKIKEGDVVYEHHGLAGDIAILPIGTVKTGVLVTGVKVDYTPKGFVTVTYSCHQSVTGEAHTDGDYRKYSPTPTFPSKRGVPRALVNCFTLDVDDAGIPVTKLSYSLQATFAQPDTDEFVAGEFSDAFEELQIEFGGQPAKAPTLSDEWYDSGTKGGDRSNTAAETYTLTLRNGLGAADAAGGG